jgi:hypothetical protein
LQPVHVYEVRPRKDHRGADLISDALPFGRLWYGEPKAIANAIRLGEVLQPSHHALIRVYDDAGNVIETHEHAGDFKEPIRCIGSFPASARARGFSDRFIPLPKCRIIRHNSRRAQSNCGRERHYVGHRMG